MKRKKNYNKDYRKELPEGVMPSFFKNHKCENCGSRIVALPPDRGWCEDKKCNTGYNFLIGRGTAEFETYQEIKAEYNV